MPKYYQYKVAGYYLYFTTACIVEAMHVHASDKKLTQEGSAKFFVKANGDTTVEKKAYYRFMKLTRSENLSKFITWKCLKYGRFQAITVFMESNFSSYVGLEEEGVEAP